MIHCHLNQHQHHDHNSNQKLKYYLIFTSITIMNSELLLLISISVSTITFSCHHCVVKWWLHADSLKVTFIMQIKVAISDWRPVTDVCGTGWVKTPSLCGRRGWQQQHVALERLRWISSCMCFVGVSWTVVDLQIDFNSWNETHRLIGYGCAVDSRAVNKWNVLAGVSDSERVPQDGLPHHTPLIVDNCKLILTVTILYCPWREL